MNFKFLSFLVAVLLYSSLLFSEQPFVTPKNGQTFDTKTVLFSWNPNSFAATYRLQIASDSSFSTIAYSLLTSANQYPLNFTDFGVYYCRFKAINELIWSPTVKIEILDMNNDPNLISWFDANTNVITADSAVSQWGDRKLISRVATQGSVSQQPILTDLSPLLNNKKSLSFKGDPSNPMQLNISPSISTNNFTFFCIRNYKYNPSGVQFFLSGNSHGFSSEIPVMNEGPSFSGLNGSVLIAPTTVLTTAFAIYAINDSTMEINKQKINFSQFAGSKFVAQLNLTSIGTRTDAPNLAYKGEIAEFLMFDTIVGFNKKNSIYSYLRNKYTPPINLGIDTVAGNSLSDSITLDAGNRFVSYQWSNGDTTPTTKVISSGIYSVKTTDVFGFQSTDAIGVYPYKRLKGATLNVCPNDSIVINLGLDPSYTILWSNGKTTSSVALKNPGQYTVKITKNSKTIWDTVNVVKNNIDLTPLSYLPGRDQNNLFRICSGEKIYIKNDSLYNSFQWSTGSSSNYGTAYNSGNVYVNYIEKNGCPLIDTLKVVIVGSAPTAKFRWSPSCQNTAVAFSDSTFVPAGNTINSWKWNFSNGNTATAQNPSTTFANLGIASASLKVTTSAGCSDSIYKTFVVNKKPVPSFYNLLSCANHPTTFVDQTVPNSAAVTDWSWNFANFATIDHVQNPSYNFPIPGTFNITLKATNSNGCFDTTSIQTTVNTSPVADFSYDSVCGITPVNFKFLATVQPPNTIPDISWGNWDFGDGTIETAIRNPQHVYAAPGAYDVMLIVRSTAQCADTAIKRVAVFDYPVVDFSVSASQCVGKEIQFTDISATGDGTPMTQWNWYFSGLATSAAQNPRYTFNTQGNYTIQLTAKNAVGCSGTKLRSIAVTAPPSPKFTFTPTYGQPPLNVTYTNQSPATGNYLWNYGDGTPLVNAFNPPSHIYTTKGTYPIQLIATDFRGCTDTLTKYILVDKAFLDGIMAAISIIPTNGDYYKIQATIINNSNIEITSMGLSLQVGGGAVIRENWTGSLLPGQTTVYLFNAEIKTGDNGQVPVICATIDNLNNYQPEDRTDNNTLCKEVAVGSFSILNVFPNPANDNVNFGVMLPKDGKVNIRFVDALGQVLFGKDFDGIRGYNQLTMPVYTLNAAVYVAEVLFDGEVARKKFMVKNKK
jgi:PKD repeat protein